MNHTHYATRMIQMSRNLQPRSRTRTCLGTLFRFSVPLLPGGPLPDGSHYRRCSRCACLRQRRTGRCGCRWSAVAVRRGFALQLLMCWFIWFEWKLGEYQAQFYSSVAPRSANPLKQCICFLFRFLSPYCMGKYPVYIFIHDAIPILDTWVLRSDYV